MSSQQKYKLFCEHVLMTRSDHCFQFKMQLFLFFQRGIQLFKNFSCAQYPPILFNDLIRKAGLSSAVLHQKNPSKGVYTY